MGQQPIDRRARRGRGDATVPVAPEPVDAGRDALAPPTPTATDAVVVLDEELTIRYVSSRIERLVGVTPVDLTGRSIDALVVGADREPLRRRLARLPGSDDVVTVSFRAAHDDGSIRWLEATWIDRSDDPEVAGLVGNIRDVTRRVHTIETLRHQALHDELTGLPNRTLLTDRMLTATSRALRGDRAFAVLFCDLDHFKHVNDTLGHDVGDALLVEVARRLRVQLRGADTLARLGGDEFVIVLEDLHRDAAEQVSQRIAHDLLAAISPPITIDGQILGITASIGIAVYDQGETVKDLLRNADVAMYAAKERGRSRAVVFDAAMRAVAQHRFAMDGLVRKALLHGGVVVDYQPLVALDSQRIIGAEALTRIELDGHRHLPGEFISAAEDAGTIVPLGRMVLQRALAEAATWHPSTSISVNVSARQLADPALPDVVIEAIAHAGIAATRLVLEVTETTLVGDNDLAISTMERLATLGVRIALDDFGTGWSSLAYLRRFPVSIVKIDRTFVAGATQPGSSDLEVVRAVIGLCHALGIKVIAEGIETELQAAVLAELGCHYGQGYLFGRPGPPTPRLRGSDGPEPRAVGLRMVESLERPWRAHHN